MALKIVLPAVALLIACAIGSGDAIDCYECISVGGEDKCIPEKLMKDMGHKRECSHESIHKFYNDLKDKPTAMDIADAFETDKTSDGSSGYRSGPHVPMSCVKMDLRIKNTPVSLRTCFDTNTAAGDPCQSIQKKIKDQAKHGSNTDVTFCGWCENNLCNGSYVLSPTMILSIIPLLGSILMSLMHSSA